MIAGKVNTRSKGYANTIKDGYMCRFVLHTEFSFRDEIHVTLSLKSHFKVVTNDFVSLFHVNC